MVNSVSSNLNSSSSGTPADLTQKLISAGIPSSVISQGREAVMAYAQSNNITLPQPPTQSNQNTSIFSQSQSSQTSSKTSQASSDEPPAELKQKLIAAGIPETTIAQGKDAVMTYAKEHNITLPAPPTKNNNGITQNQAVGSNLNLET